MDLATSKVTGRRSRSRRRRCSSIVLGSASCAATALRFHHSRDRGEGKLGADVAQRRLRPPRRRRRSRAAPAPPRRRASPTQSDATTPAPRPRSRRRDDLEGRYRTMKRRPSRSRSRRPRRTPPRSRRRRCATTRRGEARRTAGGPSFPNASLFDERAPPRPRGRGPTRGRTSRATPRPSRSPRPRRPRPPRPPRSDRRRTRRGSRRRGGPSRRGTRARRRRRRGRGCGGGGGRGRGCGRGPKTAADLAHRDDVRGRALARWVRLERGRGVAFLPAADAEDDRPGAHRLHLAEVVDGAPPPRHRLDARAHHVRGARLLALAQEGPTCCRATKTSARRSYSGGRGSEEDHRRGERRLGGDEEEEGTAGSETGASSGEGPRVPGNAGPAGVAEGSATRRRFAASRSSVRTRLMFTSRNCGEGKSGCF